MVSSTGTNTPNPTKKQNLINDKRRSKCSTLKKMWKNTFQLSSALVRVPPTDKNFCRFFPEEATDSAAWK